MAEKDPEKMAMDTNERGPSKATETPPAEIAKLPADIQAKLKKLDRLDGRFQGRRLRNILVLRSVQRLMRIRIAEILPDCTRTSKVD